MSSIPELIQTFQERGIQLWAEGEKLRFRAPKGALTTADKGILKARKRELIAWFHTQATAGSKVAPILPYPADEPKILSSTQERLWFLDLMAGPKSQYNLFGFLEMTGELNEAVLADSLDLLVERHESLRSGFLNHEGEPALKILPAAKFPLKQADFRGLDAVEYAAKLDTEIVAFIKQPFELVHPPLIRGILFHLEDKRWLLGISMHHIISDGLSISILVNEFSLAYESKLKQETVPLSPLKIQYSDYARWQKEWLAKGEEERQLQYWTRKLEGAPQVLELPLDFPRGPGTGIDGKMLKLEMDSELRQAIRKLNQETGTTFFMTGLAVYFLVLSRYCRVEDLIVGTPVANRTREETENLVGFFANTLLIRGQIDGHQSFRAFLEGVKNSCLEAYQHQDLPFEKLVEALAPSREMDRNPLFQVLFSHLRTDRYQVDLPDLTVRDYPVTDLEVKVDLAFSIDETDEFCMLHLDFNTGLHTEQFAQTFLDSYLRLFRKVIAGPDQALGSIGLLEGVAGVSQSASDLSVRKGSVEHGLGLNGLVQSESLQNGAVLNASVLKGDALPDQLPLFAEYFKREVAARPDAPAIWCADGTLSYQELDRLSSLLAGELLASGLRSGERVGVCLPRNKMLPASLLAVWKAGGAYVPLDPAWPAERVQFMLEDAAVGVLICGAAQHPLLGTWQGQKLDPAGLDFKGGQDRSKPAAGESLSDHSDAWSWGADGDALAYLIYTSGSTGKPKGVMIRHRGLAAMMHWALQQFGPDSLRRTLASTSVCFDLSAFELFVPLAAGQEVMLVENVIDLARFVDQPDQVPSLVNTVPSAIRTLLQLGRVPKGIRTVNLAGEPLSEETVRALYALPGIEKVYNLYGPSEDTTYSTWKLCQPDAGAKVTIGKPVSGTTAVVLDAYRQILPPGIPGELALSGAGVAAGYHARPELTSARFVPGFEGDRMYLTGDLVRLNSQGELDFLGRIDQQVKVRGFRIEPGEIEAQLRAVSGVREAVVLARDLGRDGLELIAWLVNDGEMQTLNPALLEHQLKRSLPAYMVPGHFVWLDALPLLPNGKLNRVALPDPEAGAQARSKKRPPFEVPEQELERLMAAQWEAVLGESRIGLQDHFFELGGDKYAAARLSGNLEAVLQNSIPVDLVFEYPVLKAFSKAVAALPAGNGNAGRIGERGGGNVADGTKDGIADRNSAEGMHGRKPAGNGTEGVNGGRPGGNVADGTNDGIADRNSAEGMHGGKPAGNGTEGINGGRAGGNGTEQPVESLAETFLRQFEPAGVGLAAGAGRLANNLQRRGLRPGFKTGMSTDDPLQLLTALCAVWHAGGVAVLIPPGDFLMAREAGLRFLLFPESERRGFEGLGTMLLSWEALEAELEWEETEPGATCMEAGAQALLWQSGLHKQHAIEIPVAEAAGSQAGSLNLTALLNPAEKPALAHQTYTECLKMLTEAEAQDFIQTFIQSEEADPVSRFSQFLDSFTQHDWPDSIDSGKDAEQDVVYKQVAALWCEILRNPDADPDVNFFRQGGHSLLATQLVFKLGDQFGLSVQLKDLFEAPTIRKMAELIRSRLVVDADLQSAAQPDDLPDIIPDPLHLTEPFPLNDVQYAYWMGRSDAFELGNVSSHSYTEMEVAGLDFERFELALNKLIDRHAMMRMVILKDGNQHILPSVPAYRIQVYDLRTESEAGIDSQIEAVRHELSHQVLPEETWPMFDFRASLLPGEKTRLHISMDALLADAWSLRILAGDLTAYYRDLNYAPPALSLSFRDYVLAESAIARTQAYQRAHAYWQERIKILPPGPELPVAVDPGSLGTPRFERREFVLSKEKWERLQEAGARYSVGPTGLLLTAFADVLAYWSKSSALTLNLTLFNRLMIHESVNELVGDFTTLNLLGVDQSLDSSFKGRAQRLQKQLWEDLDHRIYSGIRVIRDMTRANNGNRVAMPVVFTSTLGMEEIEEGDGVDWMEEVYGITQTPQVWLDHQVGESAGALELVWDAVEGLFPEGMLDAMFEAYTRWLEVLADHLAWWDNEQWPAMLPQLQEQKRKQVNATAVPAPEGLLHQGFEKMADRFPDAPAYAGEETTLSYGEVDRRTRLLARELLDQGLKPGELVAVVMEKGWEQVIAVLAILSAGGAYVPIDPHLPASRIQYLLATTDASQVLRQPDILPDFDWPERCAVVVVTDEGLTGTAPARPVQVRKPDDLAYIIFTSGSTGQPKGVMINHEGAANTCEDLNRRFDIGASDRVLSLSNLNFDLSVYDIFGVLGAGGCIVMPGPETVREPSGWAKLAAKHQVTIWNTVPALMQMYVDYVESKAGQAPGHSLKRVLMSGDWIPVSLPDRIKAIWPDCHVYSLGGATEASIWSIHYRIGAVDTDWSSIPYGKPLGNQGFVVLNKQLEPCPEWVPGDLYISGIGLAMGYWKAPEKTAGSFIVHPRSGMRLYRTGDLGRYLPDGNIEFLGREDFQVKVNGYRIELGEIEAALLDHEAVAETVVIAKGPDRHRKQLYAYVVPANGSSGKQAEDYQPPSPDGVLNDPVERAQFKLDEHGVRKTAQGETEFSLQQPDTDALFKRFLKRQSYREFDTNPISAAALSALLASLMQIRRQDYSLPKYLYPSSGSLYPVQTYVFIKPGKVSGLEGGGYYYHPVHHSLVKVCEAAAMPDDLYRGGNGETFSKAAFCIYLVGEHKAIQPMYGKAAHDLLLVEGGYMSQLLCMEAPEHQLGLCPVGYVYPPAVMEMLGLGESHQLIHSLFGGGITVEQMGYWGAQVSQPVRQEEDPEEALKAFIGERVPAYMVPARIMVLDKIPLTANGKVDRTALPEPAMDTTGADSLAPQTPVQQKLAAICEDLLGRSSVGLKDNFFALGGDSLLVTRYRSMIIAELGVELPLNVLFSHATVEALAVKVEALSVIGEAVDAVSEEEELEEIEL